MTVPYIGNSAYCFTHGLAMCLQHAGASSPPDVGFLECLTGMPFGVLFLDVPGGPLFFPSPSATNPDRGLTDAVTTLGWACDSWQGDDPGEATARLRHALASGPVLVGPLDMGDLVYDPNHRAKRGGDHYVVVVSLEGDLAVVHDPQLFPSTPVDLGSLLQACRRERPGYVYVEHAFALRSGFRQERDVSRSAMVAQTLDRVRAWTQPVSSQPDVCDGPPAFERLAAVVRREVRPGLAAFLTNFAFPLAARRSLDAAGFVAEAGLHEAADRLRARAEQYGRSQREAVRGAWGALSDRLQLMGELETRIQEAIACPESGAL